MSVSARDFAALAAFGLAFVLVAGPASADPPRGNSDGSKGKPEKADKHDKAANSNSQNAPGAKRGLDRAAERASEQGLSHGKAHQRSDGADEAWKHKNGKDDERDGDAGVARGERRDAERRNPEGEGRPEAVGIPAPRREPEVAHEPARGTRTDAPGREPEVHDGSAAERAEKPRGIFSRMFGFLGFGGDE